jgi:hypothetical protein
MRRSRDAHKNVTPRRHEIVGVLRACRSFRVDAMFLETAVWRGSRCVISALDRVMRSPTSPLRANGASSDSVVKQQDRHNQAFSRPAPEFWRNHSPQTRAQGKPGAEPTPIASRAKWKKHTSVVATGSPGTPGFPRAMVLTVSFALSLVSRAFCHHRRQQCVRHCGPLDISVGISGPHDFSVRFCTVRQRAAKASIASRAQRP